MVPPPDLPPGALHHLFSLLPGDAVAACAQVCRSWRAVAGSELLWKQQVEEQLEPHPHLRRDDLLPDFGGSWRAYHAWRWPLLRRRLQRILVEADQVDGPPSIAAYDAAALVGGGGGGGSGSGGAAMTPLQVQEPVSMQATLSPGSSGLLVYSELTEEDAAEARIVVADARTGARVCHLGLGSQVGLPYFFQFTPCGTRLLFLGNYHGHRVALHTLDLAPAMLPPHLRRPLGREVLLCAARPLFLDCSPTSTRVLWHAGGRFFGLSDAAHKDDEEDGVEHDCWAVSAALCRAQAPQWAVDGSGVAWLLLPVMHCAINAAAAAALAAQFGSSDDDDAARDVGTLVLAPLDAVSEALEAEGSRLSPSLLLSISQPVANFSSAQGLQFAANCDCSMVAWCESGRLHVHFRGSGVSHPVWPQPQEMRSTVMREAIREQGRYPTDSSLVGPMWMDSVVIAMQWSPDGRRLLLLLRHPNAPMQLPGKHPTFRWAVWDAPAAPPPPLAATDACAGWLGSFTACCPFKAADEFIERFLPFVDQYARTMCFWSPCSGAFCFASMGRPPAVSDEPSVSVQSVPRPCSGSGGSGSGGSSSCRTALLFAETPPPVWLGRGKIASWSWQ